MEKKRNSQTIIIAVLAVAVLFMSVGFAALSQTLNIQGNVQVEASTWDIHWDTTTYNKTSGSVDILDQNLTPASQPSLSGTDVVFGAKLTKPGDFAEFTIDAVNAGTIDAKLVKITLRPTLTTAQQQYLTYTVTYGGTEYTTTTDNLNVSLPAQTSNTVTVKVRVAYTAPESASSLPQTAENITFEASFDYEQA